MMAYLRNYENGTRKKARTYITDYEHATIQQNIWHLVEHHSEDLFPQQSPHSGKMLIFIISLDIPTTFHGTTHTQQA
jgi:hypothetical protein